MLRKTYNGCQGNDRDHDGNSWVIWEIIDQFAGHKDTEDYHRGCYEDYGQHDRSSIGSEYKPSTAKKDLPNLERQRVFLERMYNKIGNVFALKGGKIKWAKNTYAQIKSLK